MNTVIQSGVFITLFVALFQAASAEGDELYASMAHYPKEMKMLNKSFFISLIYFSGIICF